MKLELQLIEHPYVFELINENNSRTIIDANEKIGGKNKGLRPMELLAGSLAACTAIDLLSILRKKRLVTANFNIEILANRRNEIPAVFDRVVLKINVGDSIDKEVVKKAAQLVIDKYCSVAASLNKDVRIDIEIV